YCHSRGLIQLGLDGRDAVAIVALCPGAGDGGDQPRGGQHLPDAVVVRVGDEQVTCVIHCHAIGGTELGLCGRDAVAVVASCAGPRDGGDQPRGGQHLPDAVVVRVGDDQVPCVFHCHAIGGTELGLCGRDAVAVVASCAGAGHGGDQPRRLDHLPH